MCHLALAQWQVGRAAENLGDPQLSEEQVLKMGGWMTIQTTDAAVDSLVSDFVSILAHFTSV